MKQRIAQVLTATMFGISLASCGGGSVDLNHGGTVPPTPVPTGGTPAPSPTGSHSPTPAPTGTHSPTPSPTGTHTPTPAPTITPTPAPTAVAACTTGTSVLGTYALITSAGNVTGSTYAQTSGSWIAETYSAATPAPTPTPTTTPAPTPTPTPTATPAPVSYLIYSGAYTVPAFTGTGANGPFTTNVTSGCFILETRVDGRPIVPSDNAVATGIPIVNVLSHVALAGTGNVATFTVTGLGPSSGTGTFTLDNGTIGSATIQSSRVLSFARARLLLEQLQQRRMLL